jgi:hypothetical protein
MHAHLTPINASERWVKFFNVVWQRKSLRASSLNVLVVITGSGRAF